MNTHGINFDIGLPLIKQKEFDILHVDYLGDIKIRFSEWLNNENVNSLIIAGQIGVGKSTFINKEFIDQTKIQADIHLKFDQLFVKTKGSFYGIFLGNIIKLSIKNNIDLSVYDFDILYRDVVSDISSFAELLLSDTISLSQLKEQKQLYSEVEQNLDAIQKQLTNLISKNTEILNRKLFIFAEGVDKFNTNQTIDIYEDIEDFLNFIEPYKVLYEANIIHLLENTIWVNKSEKLIIPNTKDDIINQMLKKRLGIYYETMQNTIPEIIKYSGGNFRQALKLLVEYEFAKRKLAKRNEEALNYAVKRVKDDFFTYISIPFELLQVIHRDKFIHSGTFKYEEKRTDSFPVYRNLILITKYQEKGQWIATINPLFQKEIEEYKPEITAMQTDEFMKFNITEILDKLASYFLEPNKKEIVIISYDDIEIARITDDYLVGKAGSYDKIIYESIDIENQNLLFNLQEPYKIIEKTTGYYTGQSYFFKEKIDNKTVFEIDKHRDRLITKNMLWWIKSEHIKDYLKNWTQLRQFVKIFDLDKDILKYIEVEDIEEDIEDLDLLDYNDKQNSEIKSKLTKILEYVKSKQNA